jgi:membrane protein DedA with SNARE-associated domain/rhodanese-related sulfurtransferase
MQQLASDIERYGPLLVLLAVLLAEGGLPLPALPLLITAGALAAQSPYQALVIILAGVGGCMLADLAWYCGSKRYGRRVLGLLCKMSMSPDFCVRQSETVFLKIGPWSLLCTKFLPGLSTISVAMAGVTKMPLPTFLLLDGMGALLFVGIAVATGWMLQDAINSVVAVVVDVGRLGALLLVALLGLYLLARWWRRRAFIRRLRTDRITVDDLAGLIKEGRKPLILDVRPKEIRQQTGIIPGALPARPEDIDALAMTYAHDLETVVYCACPNEASAAMAAKHLARAGFTKIRPLLGGIDAWVQAGQPLEPAPASAIPTGRRARDHLAGALPVERKDPGDVPAH